MQEEDIPLGNGGNNLSDLSMFTIQFGIQKPIWCKKRLERENLIRPSLFASSRKFSSDTMRDSHAAESVIVICTFDEGLTQMVGETTVYT